MKKSDIAIAIIIVALVFGLVGFANSNTEGKDNYQCLVLEME